MIAAFVAFWVLLFLGREELGLKGIAIAIALWLAVVAGFYWADSPGLFMAAQAIMDVVLVFIVFGGDVRIR